MFIKEFNQATNSMIKKRARKQEKSILRNKEYKQRLTGEKC